MNPKVDFYFTKAKTWQEEIKKLRTIILACGLEEELKWGVPCYRYQETNIILIHTFKDYCAVLFFKGALLKDTDNILTQQTKNVQAARQIRFTNAKELTKMAPTLKAYIYEAIEIEKAGLKVPMKKATEFEMAEEFQKKLDKMPKLKTAFEALTPGRQRAYLLHFSSAKLPKTREARVEESHSSNPGGKGAGGLISISHKSFHGFILGQAKLVVSFSRFPVPFFCSNPKLTFILTRKNGPVFLRLMFKDGIAFTHHFLWRERHGHFNFVCQEFMPGATVHPEPAVRYPAFSLAQSF